MRGLVGGLRRGVARHKAHTRACGPCCTWCSGRARVPCAPATRRGGGRERGGRERQRRRLGGRGGSGGSGVGGHAAVRGSGHAHRLVQAVLGGRREHQPTARPQALPGVLLDVVRRGARPRGRRGGVGLVALGADEGLARLGALGVLRLVPQQVAEVGLAKARHHHLDLLAAPLPEAAALALVVDLARAAEPVRRAVLERLLRRVEDALAAARRALEAVAAGGHARAGAAVLHLLLARLPHARRGT